MKGQENNENTYTTSSALQPYEITAGPTMTTHMLSKNTNKVVLYFYCTFWLFLQYETFEVFFVIEPI